MKYELIAFGLGLIVGAGSIFYYARQLVLKLIANGEDLRSVVDHVDGGTHLGQSSGWQKSADAAIEKWDAVAEQPANVLNIE